MPEHEASTHDARALPPDATRLTTPNANTKGIARGGGNQRWSRRSQREQEAGSLGSSLQVAAAEKLGGANNDSPSASRRASLRSRTEASGERGASGGEGGGSGEGERLWDVRESGVSPSGGVAGRRERARSASRGSVSKSSVHQSSLGEGGDREAERRGATSGLLEDSDFTSASGWEEDGEGSAAVSGRGKGRRRKKTVKEKEEVPMVYGGGYLRPEKMDWTVGVGGGRGFE